MTEKARIYCVVGARPNYMKVAPALKALRRRAQLDVKLIHTGQHYDPEMSDQFFEQLQIPRPDFFLDVGSGSHSVQTARVLERIEPILVSDAPDLLIVAGDVNSTLAAALAAAKLHIPVAHIEAGLRSYDRDMPEEINRVLVDQISDILYTTERTAHHNLAREGISQERVVFVGNLMIDSLMDAVGRAPKSGDLIAQWFGAGAKDRLSQGYAVLTLHRPSNVDSESVLRGILKAIDMIAQRILVIFPVHPRTRARIADLNLPREQLSDQLLMQPPVGYMQMVGLMRDCRLMLTDSGGLQEETTALGIPCLTLRENTERPITVDEGTNTVVGCDPAKIVDEALRVLDGKGKQGRVPEGWDGQAAERLASHVEAWLKRAGRG